MGENTLEPREPLTAALQQARPLFEWRAYASGWCLEDPPPRLFREENRGAPRQYRGPGFAFPVGTYGRFFQVLKLLATELVIRIPWLYSA